MKRRKFLKNIGALSTAPLLLGGMPVQAMSNKMLKSMGCSDVPGRSLVIIQMHGGNDGLNMLIPVNQYSTYQTLRPNIAIPDTGTGAYVNLDTNLALADQIGLHPDMGAFKSMYDAGNLHIIQGCSYNNNNKSHFKATDDWMTGSDNTNAYTSGWIGRYLDHTYPNYPANYPNTQLPDPLGLQLGSTALQRTFDRDGAGAMGIAVTGSPSGFLNLVSNVGGQQPTSVPNSDFGARLQHLIDVKVNSNAYAARIDSVYNAGINSANVTYPTTYHSSTAYNPLTPQLKIVAKLLSGGSKTKIFLVRINGFDTHVDQVDATNTWQGKHAVLLYHLGESIKAFLADLADQGIGDDVMVATISEFGRRAIENGSTGTDHGTIGPMFVMGAGVEAGISGTNPDLSNLNGNNLQGVQHDYRRVFTTLLQDWLGTSNQGLSDANFNTFQTTKIPFIQNNFIAPANCYMAPFPVGLLAFDAHPQANGDVLCEWRTANERNNDFFEVERSLDGDEFESIGKIGGNGTTSSGNSYSLTDENAQIGISYYRLKQTDYDGMFQYFNTVTVLIDPGEQALTYKAYPNPAKEHVYLEIISAIEVDATLHIHNTKGQLIKSNDLRLSQGKATYEVDTYILAAGIYIFRLDTARGESFSYRQVIE